MPVFDFRHFTFHASLVTQTNEFTISRHAAQTVMQLSLRTMQQPCLGLLAGHGNNIDAAIPLIPSKEMKGKQSILNYADAETSAAKISSQGMSILGWFHSRTDSHEPEMNAVQILEKLSSSITELAPAVAVPIHLLVALDMRGRLDLYAYAHNHENFLIRIPLRLIDDSPLYLHSPRR